MSDFTVRVVVRGDIGTLEWNAQADRATLEHAVSLAADDALIGQGLRRIEACVPASDERGRWALQRAGFRLEGRRRSVVADGEGGFTDALLYARLVSDQVYGPMGFTSVMDSVMATHRLIGHVLIRDEAGRVLFVETTYKKDWELPGGIVEAGETPRRGAERELEEELGMHIDLDQPLVIDWMPPYLGWSDAVEFIFDGGRLDSSQAANFKRPRTEIAAYHWLGADEIPRHVTALSARRLAALLAGLPLRYTENGGNFGQD
ncbi:8-oxo-dGTP pyrophosphatase MutT, NUDIX family [Propionibacterium cyclohexanicum]|uniref:8-oxo-dGTP pyrophosphatase MutT, NUDIX family n=1 Tax=Propionibacterium cyclohexanicum TaxID=64702 RepID=A0A1H9R1N1_9ACTN|nr:NUDIX hydrolase [Propionibacterium cyclohexanicum]SER66527.1 8-oxo-dGTP pyrophosphatase MutT, NUDIX family [Propionibacterium cyclohexanicum]